MEFEGKVAVITGAGMGMGKAIAIAFAEEGASIVVVDVNIDTGQETVKAIQSKGGRAIFIQADVSNALDVQQIAVGTVNAFERIDILVNNAGGPPPGDFRDWVRRDWVDAVTANMITPIELIKATVDGMIDRQFGRIVNITSGSTKSPIQQLGLSNGARTGLAGFVAGIARQTVKHNVTINNILPGPFETDRLTSAVNFAAEKMGKPFEEVYRLRAEENPAKRFGQPSEFGDACAFLCGAQMGYVTGQHFLMDGGAYPGTF